MDVDSGDTLPRGSLTAISRVGNTLHRGVGPWSPAVHELLRHLSGAGFLGAPRFLGNDAAGREVLSYIDGDAYHRPWPAPLLRDSGVEDLAALVRRYHASVADYCPVLHSWQIEARPLAANEVILHGDVGPWNTIWRGDRPVALIDWDLAHPGQRVEELAQLAWYVVPLRDDEHCRLCGFHDIPDRRARLSALCRGYGWADAAQVVDAAIEVMRYELKGIQQEGARGVEPWASYVRDNQEERVAGAIEWTMTNRSTLT